MDAGNVPDLHRRELKLAIGRTNSKTQFQLDFIVETRQRSTNGNSKTCPADFQRFRDVKGSVSKEQKN